MCALQNDLGATHLALFLKEMSQQQKQRVPSKVL